LRPVAPDEAVDRATIFLEAGRSFVAERVEGTTLFKPGDRVRVSIESGRRGYLYLLDREMYADGSTGEPYLIFPTDRLRDGDNRVRAGRVVEVPALSDSPSYFKMTSSRPDQMGEELI